VSHLGNDFASASADIRLGLQLSINVVLPFLQQHSQILLPAPLVRLDPIQKLVD
jgi:hypothetical protein